MDARAPAAGVVVELVGQDARRPRRLVERGRAIVCYLQVGQRRAQHAPDVAPALDVGVVVPYDFAKLFALSDVTALPLMIIAVVVALRGAGAAGAGRARICRIYSVSAARGALGRESAASSTAKSLPRK